jgi:hypothetical protein
MSASAGQGQASAAGRLGGAGRLLSLGPVMKRLMRRAWQPSGGRLRLGGLSRSSRN